MRFSTALAVAGLSAVAVAQINLSDLPQCAQGCVGSSINVPGCSGLDIKCICSNSGYLNGLSCCIAKSCSPSDQQKAIQFASQLCSTAGVTVPNSVSCNSASSSSSSSSPSASSTPSSTASSSSAASSPATTPTTSSTSPSGSSSPLAVSTNVGSQFVITGMGFAGFVAALVAMF